MPPLPPQKTTNFYQSSFAPRCILPYCCGIKAVQSSLSPSLTTDVPGELQGDSLGAVSHGNGSPPLPRPRVETGRAAGRTSAAETDRAANSAQAAHQRWRYECLVTVYHHGDQSRGFIRVLFRGHVYTLKEGLLATAGELKVPS